LTADIAETLASQLPIILPLILLLIFPFTTVNGGEIVQQGGSFARSEEKKKEDAEQPTRHDSPPELGLFGFRGGRLRLLRRKLFLP
jgi:hypothetical protein